VYSRDLRFKKMEVTNMRSKLISRGGLVLATLFMCLGAGNSAHAALTSAAVTTNKGCGSGATFVVGDSIAITFSVTQDSSDTSHLTLQLQNGSSTTTLFNRDVLGSHTFQISGTVGSPSGTRTLTLTATPVSPTTGTQITKMCSYTVTSSSQTLTGSVRTQRGCGVTFMPGDIINYLVTSSLSAHATVVLTRAGVPAQTLFDGDVPAGTSLVAQRVASSTTGTRTITLTLTKTGFPTVTATCTYDVQGGGFAPINGGSGGGGGAGGGSSGRAGD
jgi:hypothetical protein